MQTPPEQPFAAQGQVASQDCEHQACGREGGRIVTAIQDHTKGVHPTPTIQTA